MSAFENCKPETDASVANCQPKPVKCGCGGASNIVKRLSRDYPVPVWYVECIKCNIETDDYFSEAEAITAWNKAMSACTTAPTTETIVHTTEEVENE